MYSTQLFAGHVNDVYPRLIKRILEDGREARPRGTVTKELNPAVLEIHRPELRLVTSYGRPVNVPFALAEVLWILAGMQEVDMLADYNSNISNYSDDGYVFNAAYGHRLRHAFGHDQLDDLIRCLKDDSDSRQAELVIAHPERDRSFDGDEKHITKDRACNVFSHAMIRGGRLNWLQILRSNDALWGVPYNLMQWTHIQEWVACHLGIQMGHYVALSDSMHIYSQGESAAHFAEAQSIAYFDAYTALDWMHSPMKPIGHKGIQDLCSIERRIRMSTRVEELSLLVDVVEPGYWRDVIAILAAHRLYVLGRDRDVSLWDVLDFLTSWCTDKVYSAATMRFYMANRWIEEANTDEVFGTLENIYGLSTAAWMVSGR